MIIVHVVELDEGNCVRYEAWRDTQQETYSLKEHKDKNIANSRTPVKSSCYDQKMAK